MTAVLRTAGLVVLAALLAVTGWWLMATNLMVHDDEGYVLIGLRQFAEHGRLYDGIFTQYGPLTYLYHDLLHDLFRVPIDHLFGRVTTLAHWCVAALGCGLLAWRLSGRYWTAPVAAMTSFACLWQMTWEPSHPGGLIAALVTLGLAVAVELWQRARPAGAMLALGLTGAALLFIKINVGVFWLCAVGAWLLVRTGPRTAWLAALGLGLLPFLLMRAHLADPRTQAFAIFTAAAGILVVALGRTTPASQPNTREWLAGAGGLLALGLVIVAAILAHGSSLTGLLRGVLIDPLQHAAHFRLPLSWPRAAWGELALTLALTLPWLARAEWRPRLADGIAAARLAALGVAVWQAAALGSEDHPGVLLRYGLPLLPLFIIPLAPAPDGDRLRPALGLVALVAVGQVLHAYPVAGTQLGWGSFLFVPVLLAGLAEAAAHLAARTGRRWPAGAVAALALVTGGAQTGFLFELGRLRWQINEPLGLPGARSLRPTEPLRYAIRIVSANAALHADMLYSRPGMFSFNLWTGLPTPTARNATHWSWLLNHADQQAIADGLAAAAQPAIVHSQPVVDLMKHDLGIEFSGPLQAHIERGYRPLLTLSGYSLLVPRDSRAAPFYIAQNFRAPAPDAPALIAVNVASTGVVERILLRHVFQPGRILAAWGRANGTVEAVRIDTTGTATGPVQPRPWPLVLDGLQQLRLYHRTPLPADNPALELVFLDEAGRVLFEAGYDPAASVSLPPAGG